MSDIFLFANGEKGQEFFGLVPTFAMEYWYVWVLFLVSVYLLCKTYTWVQKWNQITYYDNYTYIKNILLILLFITLYIIGIRGGMQLRPITILSATESAGTDMAPGVLNSTFSLIRTYSKTSLQIIHDFPTDEVGPCFNGMHKAEGPDTLAHPPNVVILVVESLSSQYVSKLGGTSQTPFLDSLMDQSLVFTHAFANARESVQGIPAILASIPAWMDEPYIFSRYATNSVDALPSLLKPRGYTSLFFHGADQGTMGFQPFCKSIGVDHYFSKDDYPDPVKDFDGSWGIWDHKYLPFAANIMNTIKPPFMATVFNLNSHHPFKVPTEFGSRFDMKGHPILSSIRYTDYSLSLFFESAKSMPWYDNTLFVITADHTGPNSRIKYSKLDEMHIPVIFFKPDGSLKGKSNEVVSQVDIMPTILKMIGKGHPFYSIGKSAFVEDCPKFNINYKSGIYQYLDSTYTMIHTGKKVIGLYDYERDPQFKQNLMDRNEEKIKLNSMELNLKMAIQTFNNNMVNDKMTSKYEH